MFQILDGMNIVYLTVQAPDFKANHEQEFRWLSIDSLLTLEFVTRPSALAPFIHLCPLFDQKDSLLAAFRIRIRIHPDPLHLAGSGSTSIPAPDPDPDPLRFLSSDPDPLKKALIWIRLAPKLLRVISKTKCFCYLRNAFSKFWW